MSKKNRRVQKKLIETIPLRKLSAVALIGRYNPFFTSRVEFRGRKCFQSDRRSFQSDQKMEGATPSQLMFKLTFNNKRTEEQY